MILPAIPIRQPWAWAILRLGKDCENRSWPLPQKYAGVPILIHAGKTIDPDDMNYFLSLDIQQTIILETGGIVGVTAFSENGSLAGKSIWAEIAKHHWRIDRARTKELPFFPCTGRLGFFTVDYPYKLPEGW